MKEVSRADFFKPIFDRGLDVHPTMVTRFPYTSEWRFPRKLGHPLYGKTVDHLDGGQIRTAYFLGEPRP